MNLNKRKDRNTLGSNNVFGSNTLPENGPIKLQALFQKPQYMNMTN